MNRLSGLDWIALILLIIGGLNWGLIGLWNFNLVSRVFGSGNLTRVIYDLVGLSAVYILFASAKWSR